jgi:predicted transcriptional regulator
MIEQEAKFSKIFDLTNQTEEHHFELLRKAYIEARYSKTYKITKKELLYIEKKISPMIKLIEKLCKQEIEK